MISPLAYVDPEAKLGKNVTVLPLLISRKMWKSGMTALSCHTPVS